MSSFRRPIAAEMRGGHLGVVATSAGMSRVFRTGLPTTRRGARAARPSGRRTQLRLRRGCPSGAGLGAREGTRTHRSLSGGPSRSAAGCGQSRSMERPEQERLVDGQSCAIVTPTVIFCVASERPFSSCALRWGDGRSTARPAQKRKANRQLPRTTNLRRVLRAG